MEGYYQPLNSHFHLYHTEDICDLSIVFSLGFLSLCNLGNVTKDSLGRIVPEGQRKPTWLNGLDLVRIIQCQIIFDLHQLCLQYTELTIEWNFNYITDV